MHRFITYQNAFYSKGDWPARVFILLLVSLLNLNGAAFSQDMPAPAANTGSLSAGSYVIAMDNVNQANSSNFFNLKAYGLVVFLLNNNVKVKWVIKSGKVKDGIDFSVNAAKIKPVSAAPANFDFRAGPFVIQSEDIAGVNDLIDLYNNSILNAGDKVKVYRTTVPTTVDIRYDLTTFKPKAILLNNGGNWKIHRDYLIKAGITFDMNSAQTSASNWSTGVASSLLTGCYTFASEAHWNESNATEAKGVTDDIRKFLTAGGNVLAECAAVRTYENYGLFHSTGGINTATENKFSGLLSTLLYPNADLSYSQIQGNVNINKGGSLKNWTYSGTLKNGEHDHAKGPASSPNIGASVAKLRTSGSGGLLFYLGNHSYNKIDETEVLNGIRMYLNAFLTPPATYAPICTTTQPPPPPPTTTTGSGDQCFVSPTIPNIAYAKSSWTINTNGNITIRTTFAKTFVDNTFGTTAIGWSKGHKFNDLVGSDHLQLALYDAAGVKKTEFSMDYITASSTVPSGYKTLGVSGGDGKMILGSATDIVEVKTSLSENFNTYDEVYTTNSPATDTSYTPNGQWIYDVWYEVTVKKSAFGSAGFGYPRIAEVHASPSKTGNNSEVVSPGTCPVIPGSLTLGNQVWNDYDGDGKRDDNEPGIPGATISLYRDNNGDNLPDEGAIATTVTDALGHYSFTKLSEGRYIVSMPILPGFQQSPNTSTRSSSPYPDKDVDDDNNLVRLVGPNDVGGILYTNAITLTEGEEPEGNTNNTLDLAQCGNGYIGDFVWDDLNGNGIQDTNEPGLNGVKVTITFEDGKTATTFTHNYDEDNNLNNPMFDGYYDFKNLGAGTYTIQFTTPHGFQSSPANQGSDDAKDSDPVNGGAVSVTLAANQSNFTIDAGYTLVPPPIGCPNVSVGNVVFNDANANGVRDANELGIGGLTVKLYADNNGDNIVDGSAIATVNTADDGTWYFGNLPAGKYIVGVITGSSYSVGANPNATPDDNKDNDNNGVSTVSGEVRSNFITLSAGAEPVTDGSDNYSNLTLDFGLRSSGKATASARSANTETIIEAITNPELSNSSVSIYPNPAKTDVALKVMATKSGSGVARITDQTGKLVATKYVMLASGMNVVKFDKIESLAAGTYYVQLNFNYQTYNHKLVVVK